MNNDWMWEKSKLDPAYSGMDRGYNNTGHSAGLRTADDIVRDRNAGTGITATSRVSNNNGGNNFISSPSGTDWAKTFGRNPGLTSSTQRSLFTSQPTSGASKPFSFDLSPTRDQAQLNLGTGASDFYRDRAANMDLTSKDHELYGAGSDYGFGY